MLETVERDRLERAPQPLPSVCDLTAVNPWESLRSVSGYGTTTSRRLAIALAVLVPLVSDFSATAWVVGMLSAADPLHHVAVRTCGNDSLDLVLAHSDGRVGHTDHAMPAFEQSSPEAPTGHADHFLRCASTGSGTMPARAITPCGVNGILAASTPVLFSSMPAEHRVPLAPRLTTALASLRITVLRI